MADWEDVPPKKVNDSNIRQYAGLNEYGLPGDEKEMTFTPTDLAQIQQEIVRQTNPKNKAALTEMYQMALNNQRPVNYAAGSTTTPSSEWRDLPQAATFRTKSNTNNSSTGWEDLPKEPSLTDKLGHAVDSVSGYAKKAYNAVDTLIPDSVQRVLPIPFSNPELRETAMSVGTGIPANLMGGLGYLSTLATGNPEAAKSVQKDVADTLTYSPTRDKSKEYTEMVQHGFENLIKASQYGVGMITHEGKASPKGYDNRTEKQKLLADNIRDTVNDAGGEMLANVAPIHLAIKGPVNGLKAFMKKPVGDPAKIAVADRPTAPGSADGTNPDLNMDGVAPMIMENDPFNTKPVETPLPELNTSAGDVPHLGIPEAGVVLPKMEMPLPKLDAQPVESRGLINIADYEKPDNGVRNTDSVTGKVVQGMDESVPTMDFPLKTEVLDADPKITKLREDIARQQKFAEEYAQSGARPEAVAREHAELDAMKQKFGDYLDQSYGIKNAKDAYPKLFETGGETKLPIEKTFDPRDRMSSESSHFDSSPEITGALTKEELSRRVAEQNKLSDLMNDFGKDSQPKLEKIDKLLSGELAKDSSKMSPEASGVLHNLIKSGDLPGAIKHIAANHTNPMYRMVAKFLDGKLDGINLKYHAGKYAGEKNYGYFDKSLNEIGLSTVGSLSPHAVIHEAIHSLTSQYMDLKPYSFLARGMDGLYKRVLSEAEKAGMNTKPLYNVREFIAEAMSDPKLQAFMKTLPASPWVRFKQLVKDMLGVGSDKKLGNALDEAIDLTQKIATKSDSAFRAKAAETFKAASIPSPIADMMAANMDKEKTPPIVDPHVQALKDSAAGKGLADFKALLVDPDKVIEMAKQTDDISKSTLQAGIENGGIYRQVATKNPIVQYITSRMNEAVEAAEKWQRDNITDPHTGLISKMRALSSKELGEVWAAESAVEGKQYLSVEDRKALNHSDAQIELGMKRAELKKALFDKVNDLRDQLGMAPMDERLGHIAGRFVGDFSRLVYRINEAGKKEIVGRFSGSTKWKGGDLDRATKYIQEQHPDWEIGPIDYKPIGKGKAAGDRFTGLMEVINLIGKKDPHMKLLVDTIKDFDKSEASKYLNYLKHAKDKKANSLGLEGSEGHKLWKDVEQNAKEGYKSELTYMEQAASWVETQKAALDTGKVLNHEDVVARQPNAVEWGRNHIDHYLGRGQTFVGDFVNGLVSHVGEMTGVGHTNITKGTNLAKHLMMQKLLGFMNIPFTAVQLTQPLLTVPSMARLMTTRGLDYSAAKAGAAGMNTMLKIVFKNGAEGFGLDMAKLTPFESEAYSYAHDHNVFNVKMMDHTKEITQSKLKDAWDFAAEANIKYPEFITRGSVFMFYAHALKEAGLAKADIFSTAANMTRISMVDYSPQARPKMYNQGLAGDLASTLVRFKHANVNQLTMFSREMRDMGSTTPLLAYVAIGTAASGILGMTGYKTADSLVRLISSVTDKPTSLTAMIQETNAPSVVTHGIPSLAGVDMTSRLGTADTIPSTLGEFLVPLGTAYTNLVGTAVDMAKQPNEFNVKRFFKELAPSSMTGLAENQMFSKKQEDGTYKTTNSRTGEGNITRDETAYNKRNFGFRDIREAKESEKLYVQKHDLDAPLVDKRKAVVDKAFSDWMSGGLTEAKAAEYGKKYTDLKGDPNNFVRDLEQKQTAASLTPTQRYEMRNSGNNATGAQRMKQFKERE